MSDVSTLLTDKQRPMPSSFGFPTAKTEPGAIVRFHATKTVIKENVSGAAGQLVLAKDEPNVFVQMNRQSVAGYRQIGSGELCHSNGSA